MRTEVMCGAHAHRSQCSQSGSSERAAVSKRDLFRFRQPQLVHRQYSVVAISATRTTSTSISRGIDRLDRSLMSLEDAAATDPPARDRHDTAAGDGAATGGEPGAAAATEGLLDAVRAVVQQELRAALTDSGRGPGDVPDATSSATPPASVGDTGEE